ncbi:MAG: PIN domain-containing protein [Thermoproteota archaeon]
MEGDGEVEAVIDTNVLIYDTVEDSVYHKDAEEKLSNLRKWVIPTVVLEEFAIVLLQLRVGRSFIREKLLEILENEKVEIAPLTRQHFIDSVNTISKESTSFKRLNDKLIVSAAKSRKLPIFTYDREIKKEWEETYE